jgi:hypothetical protein
MSRFSWERSERIRENEDNESRPLLINDGDDGRNVATAENPSRISPLRFLLDRQNQRQSDSSTPRPPPVPTAHRPNFDSFYHAALLMAEAARNAEEAVAAAAAAAENEAGSSGNGK